MLGLGEGVKNNLTLGALEILRDASRQRILRKGGSEAASWLQTQEGGVDFDFAFNDISFPCTNDDAGRIVDEVIKRLDKSDIVYVTPGHPVLSERASTQLYLSALNNNVEVEIINLDKPYSRKNLSDFESLVQIMVCLRDPVNGCPWDREQTPDSVKKYIIEEAYEVLEAIDSGSSHKYAEELGDLILQVVFHAQMAREINSFNVDDVISHIVEKMVRRHPHVFGDVAVDGAEQVLSNWEKIKRKEKGYEDRVSILDGIPKDLPALMRAMEVSKKVVKVGFEWPTIMEVLDKVEEEIHELREEIAAGDKARAQAEMGDLLFTLVNVSRQLKIDPEEALRAMTHRFANRFRHIERHAEETGRTLEELSLEEMESIWQAAKKHD